MTISTKPVALMDILGVQVADYSKSEALAFIHACVDQGRYQPVAFLNANNANIAWTDRQAFEAFEEFVVLSDGIVVDIAARMLHGSQFKANLNGTDFVPALLKSASRSLSVGLLGAATGVAEKAAARFAQIDPRHDYQVISHGYFDANAEDTLLATLADWRPDILLVALGTPRQEKWVMDKLTSEHCTVPIAVGALLDFVAGNAARAPKWVRALRSEWAYRLALEPSRLWRRYVLGNPVFLARAIYQKLQGTRQRSTP